MFTLFYSKYLGPEIKNVEKIPYYGRERIFSFFLGQKRGFSHFVVHVKRRHCGPKVKRPYSFYWRAELNFGQEPVFFKRPYCKLLPEKLFSNY